MSTTNLFVELIVIGVGATAWVVLLVLALIGVDKGVLEQILQPAVALPVLAFVYVLGIVMDRLSDMLLEKLWGEGFLSASFKSRAEYYRDRRLILTHSERLSDLLEYGRSRMRICRGWAVNWFLIALALDVLLIARFPEKSWSLYLGFSGTAVLLLLSFATWISWRRLVLNEYRKIREQADFIELAARQEKETGPA